MVLEQVGIFLLDRRAAVVGLARLVGVLGIGGPEGADRLHVGGVEGLDEVVGRGADRLLVGLMARACGGGRRLRCRISRCRISRSGGSGRQQHARADDQSTSLRPSSHKRLLF